MVKRTNKRKVNIKKLIQDAILRNLIRERIRWNESLVKDKHDEYNIVVQNCAKDRLKELKEEYPKVWRTKNKREELPSDSVIVMRKGRLPKWWIRVHDKELNKFLKACDTWRKKAKNPKAKANLVTCL